MLNLSKSLEDILSQLIQIPSETGNEGKIFAEIRDSTRSLKWQGFPYFRELDNNLIIKTGGKGETNIGLVGHMDTVPASRQDQTVPDIRNGYIYGLGAVDMKAGLACMLKLTQEVATGKVNLKDNLSFVFYEGEEGPLPNGMTRMLNKSALDHLDFAFVLEPTSQRYDIGCLGSITASISVKGRSAHSASPHLGINAIYEANDLIDKIRLFKSKKVKVDKYFVTETMNITGIRTNNSHNMIPSEVVMVLNYRFPPMVSLKEAKDKVISIIEPNDDIHIKFTDLSPSCFVSADLNKYLISGIERSILPGWTDIAQLNRHGIAAINYGPGNLAVAHTSRERISIKELNKFYNSLKKHLVK